MPINRTIPLASASIPAFLYGTAWKEEATQRCVREALAAGFRGIDTANQRKHYHEAGVGAALREAYETGTVTRAELFLQTKFTHIDGQDQRLPYDPRADIRTQVMQSFASSLEHLHAERLDSYILHGPALRSGLTDEDWAVWGAMEDLQSEGKVSLIGVSNVAPDQVLALCEHGRVKPAFVQNRCYASRGWDGEVRRICSTHGVRYQGFSLLTANTALLQHPRFRALASGRGCTPAQLVFAFSLHMGMLPLTGTSNPAHMREDLGSFGVDLSSEQAGRIERLALDS